MVLDIKQVLFPLTPEKHIFMSEFVRSLVTPRLNTLHKVMLRNETMNTTGRGATDDGEESYWNWVFLDSCPYVGRQSLPGDN